MTVYIRDVFNIPEGMQGGSYVHKLADGVADAATTLAQYVVTPQLCSAFDDALGLIEDALRTGASKAAYLHGSFGSGKSHFMAVLHLLLGNHKAARGIDRLQPVLAKRELALDKRFLMVPFHMVGAESLEQAVFDGYVRHLQAVAPDAAPPAVYRTEDLFANAQRLRASLGDDQFFAELSGTQSRLGSLAKGHAWTPARFDAALGQVPHHAERRALLGALVKTHFAAYKNYAAGDREALVSFDDGLAALSQHAKGLGYDGLILFLDEVVLWLSTRARGDAAAATRDFQTLVKLVEAQNANRPVPIISFLARQRELQELIGEDLDGADRARIDKTTASNHGRFPEITLADRNLPLIARERFLKPKDAVAAEQIEGAFDRVRRAQRTFDTLMTGAESIDEFRAVYPFSPALVQALVSLSQALQRERTALRVMATLLVNERDTLELGKVVPVGDLWDVVADNEPFSAEMKGRFAAARRLYRERLKPLLVKAHGVDPDELGVERTRAWEAARNDARLMKTLLLGALIPAVEVLKGLDAERIAALNWGTINSPIPGREGKDVLRKIDGWRASVGEIRFEGDPNNPTIRLELSNVDVQSILDAVAHEDKPGNRKRLLMERLFQAFGVDTQPAPGQQQRTIHELRWVWRGVQRRAELVYANVRELAAGNFANPGEDWKVIVDYPFDDDPKFGPSDDVEAVARHRQGASARTLVWLPRFFSEGMRKDLGLLARIEYLFTGDTFERNAGHLNPSQRAEARALLESQRSALGARLAQALANAYGLRDDAPQALDEEHAHHTEFFASLLPGFRPQRPPTGELKDGLRMLLEQGLAHVYPAAPELGGTGDAAEEVKVGQLRKVWGWCAKALDNTIRRAEVEGRDRPLVRSVVEPLGLGQMGETAVRVDDAWCDFLERARLAAGFDAPSVADLYGWIDRKGATGLPNAVKDLYVLVYARHTNRGFQHYQAPVPEPKLGELAAGYTLVEQDLPDEVAWGRAKGLAEGLLGVRGEELRSLANVGRFAEDAGAKLRGWRGAAARVKAAYPGRAASVGANPRGRRLELVDAVLALPDPEVAATPKALVEALARRGAQAIDGALIRESEARLEKAAEALERRAEWGLFARLGGLEPPKDTAAQALLDALREVLAVAEAQAELGPLVHDLYQRGLELLTDGGGGGGRRGGGGGTQTSCVARGEVTGSVIDWVALQGAVEAEAKAGDVITLCWIVEREEP